MKQSRHKPDRQRIAVAALALTLLAGCASKPARMEVPSPLTVPAKADAIRNMPESADDIADQRNVLTQTPTPRVEAPATTSISLGADERLPPMGNTPVNINVTDLPLPVLANEVFGNILGLNVKLDPEVAALQELVTLNTSDNLAPTALFRLARQVLADYGVAVDVEGQLVRLRLAPKGSSVEPPLVISGRALPTVPVSHRPVYQLVEMEVVRSGDAVRWLSTLFGSELKVTEETARNAVLISGRPLQVRQAIEALAVFDRPLMRGRISTRLEPAFLPADELAARLTDVLNLQGYSANRSVGAPSSVIVLPIGAANSIIIFATTQQTLDYAVSWARELDRPSKHAGGESMFYYQVRNTKATELAKILTPSLRAAPVTTSSDGASGGGAATSSTASLNNSTILVDEPRNALIYQGDPAQWERTLALIRQMDRAPRQVMIEVTIAEVTLNDDKDWGLSWFARNGFGDRFNGNAYFGGESGGNNPGPASSGLTYLIDVAGQNRAVLKAFANDNRVSILWTPRL